MKRLWFWGLIGVLTAVITHLGYVLYAPRYQMSRLMQAVLAETPMNSLSVLGPGRQKQFFPGDPPSVLRALCPFDLARGPVVLKAALPDAVWVASVHGKGGAVDYVLNREQAGVSDIIITIKPPKGLGGLAGPGEGENDINDGWTLDATDTTGLAVIAVMFPNPFDRLRGERRLKQSSCALSPQA